jgi:hypothetical protein
VKELHTDNARAMITDRTMSFFMGPPFGCRAYL